jgi:uncharacterized RmlC-like cupin family protein
MERLLVSDASARRANTGPHHHGRHEVAIYVVKGRSEIRWGERLECAAEVGQGDFVYFTPFVPHLEFNIDASETVDFVVVRSDNEKIVVNLDVAGRPTRKSILTTEAFLAFYRMTQQAAWEALRRVADS